MLNPALQTALTLNAGNFNVNLLLQRTDSTATGRTVRVVLSNSSLGTIDTEDLTFTQNTSALIMYPLVLNTAGVVAPVGSTFSLQVTNLSTGSGQRSFNLVPYSGTNYSRVDLNSATIINVNSVQTWTQTWNNGAQQGTWYPGNTRVRARADQRSVRQLRYLGRHHQPHRCGWHDGGGQRGHDGAGRGRRLRTAHVLDLYPSISVHRARIARDGQLDHPRDRRTRASKVSPTSASAASWSRRCCRR